MATKLSEKKKRELKAEAQKARKRLMEKIRRNQKKYREDHKALARAIAKEIRSEIAQTTYLNGEMPDPENPMLQWFQDQWGSFNIDDAKIIDKDNGIIGVDCGTTGCIAGWATTLAGFPMMAGNIYTATSDYLETWKNERKDWGEKVFDTSHCWNPFSKEKEYIEIRAQKLLKLDNYEREWLFAGGNSKEMVLWALDEIGKHGTFDPSVAPFDDDDKPLPEGMTRRRYEEDGYTTIYFCSETGKKR